MNSLEQGGPVEPTDGDYVQRSRNGSPEDFSWLVERYQRPLFAYLTGRLRDESEAEEAAQESFVRAFLSLKKLRQPESFYAWLIGIAGRVVKEHFRHQNYHRQQDRVEAVTAEIDTTSAEREYPLEEVIALLPETYRRVILLRYYEGLSCQEIGQHLGMPLGTVTKTLSRAYALLREELNQREGEEQYINQTGTL
jgi:RNA polymerase sigma-70 factor (ECF subfamily)